MPTLLLPHSIPFPTPPCTPPPSSPPPQTVSTGVKRDSDGWNLDTLSEMQREALFIPRSNLDSFQQIGEGSYYEYETDSIVYCSHGTDPRMQYASLPDPPSPDARVWFRDYVYCCKTRLRVVVDMISLVPQQEPGYEASHQPSRCQYWSCA